MYTKRQHCCLGFVESVCDCKRNINGNGLIKQTICKLKEKLHTLLLTIYVYVCISVRVKGIVNFNAFYIY